jgi:hypothetical protein
MPVCTLRASLRCLSACATVLIVAWFLIPASAFALTFQFEGVVLSTHVSSSFTGTLPFSATVGVTQVTGQAGFDPSTAGILMGPGMTDFPQAGNLLSFSLPGFEITLPVTQTNTSVEAGVTRFGLTAFSDGIEATKLGVAFVEVLFGILGPPGLLPIGVQPTDVSDATWNVHQEVMLRGWEQIGPTNYRNVWLVQARPLTIVPEPSTGLLLAAALAVLGVHRRKTVTR